jgi:hypothetical protein
LKEEAKEENAKNAAEICRETPELRKTRLRIDRKKK